MTIFSTKYHQKRGGFSPEAKTQTSSYAGRTKKKGELPSTAHQYSLCENVLKSLKEMAV